MRGLRGFENGHADRNRQSMTRYVHRHAAIAALTAALLTSGCADLPVVGPLYQSVAPMLAPILSPIKGWLGISEPPPPPVKPTPRPRSRGARAQANGQTAGATGSAAVAAENPEAQFARYAQRNKEFDRLRTTGLHQLYAGETRMAIESFEKAAQLRPDDAHIRELIELAKNPPRPNPAPDGDFYETTGGFLE